MTETIRIEELEQWLREVVATLDPEATYSFQCLFKEGSPKTVKAELTMMGLTYFDGSIISTMSKHLMNALWEGRVLLVTQGSETIRRLEIDWN